VGGAICFDMNFRELFEGQRAKGADLFLCPSLFPGGDQVNHWALATQRPAVIAYPAWSRVIDVLGHEVVQGGYRHETLRFGFGVPLYTADVNFDKAVFHFDRNQEKIEAILRQYGADVGIDFDQLNSRFALESRSSALSVREVANRFQLQGLDDYMVESDKAVRAFGRRV
jgi:hypothetical protein